MFKRRLSVGLAAAALLVCIPVNAHAREFSDVSPTSWYHTAVEYATGEGLFAGTSADTFSPDLAMTRGMFVTVLGRQAGVSSEKPTDASFYDVSLSAYYAPYLTEPEPGSFVCYYG